MNLQALADALPDLSEGRQDDLSALANALPDLRKERGFPPIAQTLAGAPYAALSTAQHLPDLLMGARGGISGLTQLGLRGLEAMSPAGSSLEQYAQNERQAVEQRLAGAREAYQQTGPEARPGSSTASMTGEALLPGGVLRRIAPAASFLGRAAQGAASGAGVAATSPVEPDADYWNTKGKQVAVGAATGGASTPIIDAIGRTISGVVRPQVQQLMDAGVTPTPGQVAGGFWKTLEEKASSIPLLGDAIKAGQSRALDQFQRAVYVRTLAPLGKDAIKVAQTAPIGNDGIRAVGDELSNAYEAALARSVPNPVTPDFQRSLSQIATMTPRALRDDFMGTIDREIYAKITPSGTLTPSVAKGIESELGRLANSYRGSSQASERELSRAYQQAQTEVRSLVAANNPEIASRISAINQGWANLVQLENAGARIGAKEGEFTPAQYLSAVKKSDSSVRDRAFARGTARNQDFAQAGDSVLSNRYPDSGTTGRTLIGLGLGGLGGYVNPAIPLAGAGAAMAYTPWGQRGIAGLLARRPEAAQNLGLGLSDVSPYLGALTAGGLLGFGGSY